MATHSSSFAWKIPWTREPGELLPWGLRELDMTWRRNNSSSLDSVMNTTPAPRPGVRRLVSLHGGKRTPVWFCNRGSIFDGEYMRNLRQG